MNRIKELKLPKEIENERESYKIKRMSLKKKVYN
jgi:hypothetical protein